jgi:hypothetical protein
MKDIFFLILTMTISGCALSQNSKLEAKILKEREQLKNYAMCKCLSFCLPQGDSLLIADGSMAGYFVIGHYSIDVYPLIDSLAKTNNIKALPSKEGKSLCFMKCLNFYNSLELKLFIEKMDSEINVNDLKD